MSTITLTFGDVAENHARMQKIGDMADCGFNLKDLENAKEKFEERGVSCELVKLHLLTGLEEKDVEEEHRAYLLVIKNGISMFVDADELAEEQKLIEVDKKALMRGRVVNKNARHNVCFADESQDPDYGCGLGRIVAYKDVPKLKKIKDELVNFFGDKARNLKCEGNYYYNIKNCYIGFHGDGERKKVIGCRLGEDFPLYHLWFYKSEPVGQMSELILKHGDMYVMSEKAVGNDWMKKNIATLRHSAGDLKNYWQKKWGLVENHTD